MLTLIAFTFLFFALATGDVSAAEGIAIGMAGVVAPFVAQGLKRWGNIAGNRALVLAIAVSAAIALAALYVSGEITSVADVVRNIAAVFGIATVVFRLIIEPPRKLTTMALIAALSLVSIGAGPCTPSKKTIEQTAETAKDLGGGTRDAIAAVRKAWEKKLITLEQKDQWADWLGEIARGGKKGVDVLDKLVKSGATIIPADTSALLNKIFSDEVVAPFLKFLTDIGKLDEAQSAAIRAAVAGLRTTILLLSTRIGRNDLKGQIESAQWKPMLAMTPRWRFAYV